MTSRTQRGWITNDGPTASLQAPCLPGMLRCSLWLSVGRAQSNGITPFPRDIRFPRMILNTHWGFSGRHKIPQNDSKYPLGLLRQSFPKQRSPEVSCIYKHCKYPASTPEHVSGSDFLLQVLKTVHFLMPTHMTMTCWLTSPSLSPSSRGAVTHWITNIPHEGDSNLQVALNSLVPDGCMLSSG